MQAVTISSADRAPDSEAIWTHRTVGYTTRSPIRRNLPSSSDWTLRVRGFSPTRVDTLLQYRHCAESGSRRHTSSVQTLRWVWFPSHTSSVQTLRWVWFPYNLIPKRKQADACGRKGRVVVDVDKPARLSHRLDMALS